MAETLNLPALQGSFGTWKYYSTLMRIEDIVERIEFAHELSENKVLSEKMQRQLDKLGRTKDIADYLQQNEDRFFNAMVVGVLGGQPEWFPFSLSSSVPSHDLGPVAERDQDLVGYLRFSGRETLFALDGQHRLSGLKRVLEGDKSSANEKLTVIFVPHIASPEGLIRTRSLFISLNKRAVPVKKKDIIILDEVDLSAIVTRRLIDQNPSFNRQIIDVERFGNAIPTTSEFWTTIGNFYDANKNIIENIIEGRDKKELDRAEKIRLTEDRINFYMAGVVNFYQRLASLEPMLKTVFAGNAAKTLREARTGTEPRLLARPVGLKIVTKVAAKFRQEHNLDETFRNLGRTPLTMTKAPFVDLIWDSGRGTMQNKGESLATRLVLYMLGATEFDAKLRESYAAHRDEEPGTVRKPRRFAAAR